jgi:hypothetical protein
MRSSRAGRLALAIGLAAGAATPAALPALTAAASTAVTNTAVTNTAVTNTALTDAAQATSAAGAASAVTVAITALGPAYARPGGKITVTGIVRNSSGAELRDVVIQLRSSGQALNDRDDLQAYVAGNGPPDFPEPGAAARVGPVAAGATASWTAVLPVSEVHMSVFGVYPLAAQASAAGTLLGTSRTLLPFWPTGRRAVRPKEDIAWLWPLIDNPDLGPCGLLSNRLAGSLDSGGRLAGLLSAGASADGQAAKLTWVIDPALLQSAQEIARPGSYVSGASVTGTDATCQNGTTHAASQQAAAWLTGLRGAVASQPTIITPYADVDIAALVGDSLVGDVHSAFTDGRTIATQVLRRSFNPPATGQQNGAQDLTTAMAWPNDGQADYAMLETLAAVDGISSVVLSSDAMPPLAGVQYTPSAVSSTPDGEGGNMLVLLADSTLTQILGSVTAQADPPGAAFAAQQLFLAQTAMIAAEAPHLSRAIVVAPPRRWDPPASLASGLLADTASAPWLTPVTAGGLAADQAASGQVSRQAPDSAGTQLASPALLRGVAAAEPGAALVQRIRVPATPVLSQAISGIESSAWSGSPAGQRQAETMLRRVNEYVAAQEHQLSIIEPGRDTLGGPTGPIPISIDNHLGYAVRVKIALTVSRGSGGGFKVLSKLDYVTIPANTVYTSKVKVQASANGSTTIGLRLLAPGGQALPGPQANMTVQSTHIGTLALVVIAGALGVFVIASASRAIRGRGRGPAAPPDGPDSGPSGGHAAGQDGHEEPQLPDTVVAGRDAPGAAGTDAVTEDADDYARVTGWADSR